MLDLTSRMIALAGVALACATPAAARAQGGLPGALGRVHGTFTPKREPAIQVPAIVQPLDLLLMHRADLALTDSQFLRVIRLKRGLDSLNAPLLRKLDSVQHVFRGGTLILSQPTAARRDSLDQAHRLIDAVVSEIRDNIGPARERAYGLLSASQRAQAERIEDDAAAREASGGPGAGAG